MHCKMNIVCLIIYDLSLRGNKFTEEGKKSLCEIVTNEHFELELIRTDSR
jgi:hypothetical protein